MVVQVGILVSTIFLVQEAPHHACTTPIGTDYVASLFPITTFAPALAKKFCPVYGLTGLASATTFLLLALPWWREWRHMRDAVNRTCTVLREQPQHA